MSPVDSDPVDLDAVRERAAAVSAALLNRSSSKALIMMTLDQSARDVPRLVAEVERLRAELAALRETPQ